MHATVTTVLQNAASWEPNRTSAAVASLLALIGVSLLVARRGRITGTTLMAPWYWALVSLLSVCACEIVLGLTEVGASRLWTFSLRFAAAVTTFCPVMAQLGAKRPQDRAWQLIVLSLWVILALPVAEAFVYQRGEQLNVRDARAIFLWVLVAMGLLNNLPTRFGFSALLFAAGQFCLLAHLLPFYPVPLGTFGSVCGLSLFVCALGMVVAGWPRSRAAACPEGRVWLDFRDMFGAMWALRVADRLNTASESYGWNLILHWNGFRATSVRRTGDSNVPPPLSAQRDSEGQGRAGGGQFFSADRPNKPEAEENAPGTSPSDSSDAAEPVAASNHQNDGPQVAIPPDVRRELHTSLRNLLRRFVSPEWIAERLDQPARD